MQAVINSTTHKVLFRPTTSLSKPAAPTYGANGADGWHDQIVLPRSDRPFVWVAIGNGTTYVVCEEPGAIDSSPGI